MDTTNKLRELPFPFEKSICYSGFRDGQSPEAQIFPTYNQVKEDLQLLEGKWKYLRLYDSDPHAKTVLEVIRNEGLDFKTYLGAYIMAEVNNPDCPWDMPVLSEEQLRKNKALNVSKIQDLIGMASQYQEHVVALSIGNEATVSWTDHLVPVGSVIEYAKMVKNGTNLPVSFCENYVPWLHKLEPLVDEIDFISIHTYPVWEHKKIDEALAYTKQNFFEVARKYPQKPIVISEAGWATNSDGRGIPPENVSEEAQKEYYHQLMEWTEAEKIVTFVFEAFDETWKGSAHHLEPEKHWGLYTMERTPKLVMEPF